MSGPVQDTIVYQICTPSTPVLGASATIPVLVFYDPGLNGPPETFESEVFITERTGDCNGNCLINIADVVCMLQFIFNFNGTNYPKPCSAGDVNINNIVNIADVVYMINFIFNLGPFPAVWQGGNPANCP